MKRTLYSHVKLPQNTIAGATVTSLVAKEGVTLERVTEDGRDDLVVTFVGNPRRSFEIAWSQIKGGVRSNGEPYVKRSVVAQPKPEPEEPTGELVNDAVRVTKPKAKP